MDWHVFFEVEPDRHRPRGKKALKDGISTQNAQSMAYECTIND
jgi:hypothetical protein